MTNRDPLAYARTFARQNPADDARTEWLIRQLAKGFSRRQLTEAERALAGRRSSPSQRRQLDLIRRARRMTFLPLDRRWL